jgi:putative transposase
MKKTRYSEEQIIGILKEAEAGIPVTELCRKYGISDATYYNWKARYGGMTTSEMKRLRQLEDENRRLKQLLADLTLDNQAFKALISKNG